MGDNFEKRVCGVSLIKPENTSEAWWQALTSISTELYPRGPEDSQVWRRAGGDLSTLDLNASGKATWFSALTKLRQGGGGKDITVATLLKTMENDFRGNPGLQKLMLEGPENDSAVSDLIVSAPDDFEYSVEEQPWYAGSLPETEVLEKDSIPALAPRIEIVLMTATDLELRAVMRLLKPLPDHTRILHIFLGSETYYVGQFGCYPSVVTKCRKGTIGQGSAILAASQALQTWHPRAVIMIGIAFGVDSRKQRIGDVLVASEIIPYESQRVGRDVIFRGPIPASDGTLLNRFENAQNWSFMRPDGTRSVLRVGAVLSGEKLVDDSVFKTAELTRHPQAIGGEMEGAGLYAAAASSKTAWILVKAICDWADGKKHKKHQALAAAAAASLVEYVLSKTNVLDSLAKS